MHKIFTKLKHFLSHPLLSVKVRTKDLVAAFRYGYYSIKYGENIILFESHYVFDGNSGALYKCLRSNKKYNRYTLVWIVQGYIDGSIKNSRHDLFFSMEKKSELKDYLCQRAKFAFFDDVPIRAGAKDGKTIYLTHGQLGLKNVKGIINVPDYVDYALCISDYYKPYFCNDVGCSSEKVFICGLPRNDVMFYKDIRIKNYFDETKYSKVVLWLPTFRKVRGVERNDTKKELPYGIPLFYNEEQIKIVDNFLKDKNILLVVKLHPIQDLMVIKDFHMSNILFIEHKSLIRNKMGTNYLYPYADAMISDYSSAATDFMLLDKPLGYIIEDQDDYKLNLPQETYDKFTPGTKIKTIDDMVKFLDMVYIGIDEYKKRREAFVNLVHTYKDGNNCSRIVDRFNI